jgi:hypothetical protein
MLRKPNRSQVASILLVVSLLLAGCSGVFGSETAGSTPTETPTEDAAPTATELATDTPAAETESGTTATDDSTSSGENRTSEPSSSMSGRMLFVINGEERHLDTSKNSAFRFNESNEHTWHANESMSLASALETTDVDASADKLSYNGTTYRESEDGTTIAYRVAGTVVEQPSEYDLEDLDPEDEISIWVTTDNGSNARTDRIVEASHPHPHGTLTVSVNGEKVNFSKEKYIMASERFHFHSPEEVNRWHGHSLSLTVAEAVSTFPGLNVTEDSLTYNGTTYQQNASGTTVNVSVNGNEVDPSTYHLKDGDDIRVSVTQVE